MQSTLWKFSISWNLNLHIIYIFRTAWSCLTHSFPIHPFSTPRKHQKTSHTPSSPLLNNFFLRAWIWNTTLTLYFPMSQNGPTHFKNLPANATKFLKCLWPFYDIAKWRFKNRAPCRHILVQSHQWKYQNNVSVQKLRSVLIRE